MLEVCGDEGDEVIRWSERFGRSLGRCGSSQFLSKVPDMMSSGVGLLLLAFLHDVCLVQLLEALSWGVDAGRAASSSVSVILVDG